MGRSKKNSTHNQHLSLRQQYQEQVIKGLPSLFDIVPDANYPSSKTSVKERMSALSAIMVDFVGQAQSLSEHISRRGIIEATREYQQNMCDLHFPAGAHSTPVSDDMFLDND